MPTKNIECQLAQGQIGRYLNGERFSAQAIKQLEAHVADCDECSELVTRRRQALMAMLGEGSTRAAVMATASAMADKAEKPESHASVEKLMEALGRSPEADVTASAPAAAQATSKVKLYAGALNSKPLMYCAALAAVLVAMSYFSKGALKTFGPTADKAPIAETEAPVKSAVTATPALATAAPTTTPSVAKPALTAPANVTSSAPNSNRTSKPATADPNAATAASTTSSLTPKPAADNPAPAAPISSDTTQPVSDPSTSTVQDQATVLPPVKPATRPKKIVKPRIRVHRKPKLALRRSVEHRLRRARRIVRRHDDDDDAPARPRARRRIHRTPTTSFSSSQASIRIYDPQGRSVN